MSSFEQLMKRNGLHKLQEKEQFVYYNSRIENKMMVVVYNQRQKKLHSIDEYSYDNNGMNIRSLSSLKDISHFRST